jgi:hypothetical protein
MSKRKLEIDDLEQFFGADVIPIKINFDRDIKLEKKRKNHRMKLPSSKSIIRRLFFK